MAQALNYQQGVDKLNSVLISAPNADGIVKVQPGQYTVVKVQAGQHYKVRKVIDGSTELEAPGNVVAVRNGDALHVRYADGSNVSFENFYSAGTGDAVASVNLAGDSAAGMDLTALNAPGGMVADDGLLVYAHGDSSVLMSMAGDQASLSAFLGSSGGSLVSFIAPVFSAGVGVAASANVSSAPAAPPTNSASTLARNAALNTLGDATLHHNASNTTPGTDVYASAGVSGVNADNLAAINSVLNAPSVSPSAIGTTAQLQTIVDAYNAILASADGVAGNTTPALTGAQFTAVGVTGVSGVAAPGTALKLLDDLVDRSAASKVDSVAELQALADAANHLIAAAGGTPAEVAALTLADLIALGLTGVTADNLPAIREVIAATVPDTAIDNPGDLQLIVTTAVTHAVTALSVISTAAENNTATSSSPTLSDYADAGISGVTAANLAAINRALDSAAVTQHYQRGADQRHWCGKQHLECR